MPHVATKQEADFRLWLKEVDQLCLKKFGLRLFDLPDLRTRDAFDAGNSPEEFFTEDVLAMMREDFGPIVDEL